VKRLMETAIVLSILLIIATITLSHVTSRCPKPMGLMNRLNMEKLILAIQDFHHDTGKAPNALKDLVLSDGHAQWLGPYIRKRDLEDPWGTPYTYQVNRYKTTYLIQSLGSDRAYGGSLTARDLIQTHTPIN
jgi:general secretion pathway protein G